MKPTALIVAISTLCASFPSYASGTCEVTSGATTAALVELYTSEGCSSCPPADKQLSQLRQSLDPNAVVVPLALHVTYWDDIGWQDVYAKKIFDARQSGLLANRKNHVVYTPQFFVNGAELREWRQDFPAAIRKINATPAPLTIKLKSTPGAKGTVTLEADVATRNGAASVDGQLYLAISENGLVSHVLRGENSGATLKHDALTRVWVGPTQLTAGGTHVRQEVTIPASWNRRQLQAVAFVQNPRDGNILQAVSTGQCAAHT